MHSSYRPRSIIINNEKNKILINKPIHSPIYTNNQTKNRSITSKYLKPFTKEVPTKKDIVTYVISDAGKLIKPHSPLESPPPLPIKLKYTNNFNKHPICKNPNKIVL